MTLSLACAGLSERVGATPLLRDVSVSLTPATFSVVLGPNGAGKSTWLRALAGEPTVGERSGAVTLGGRRLADWDPGELARARAVVPQRPTAGFALAAWELVGLGRLPWRGLTAPDHDAAEAALARVGATHLAARRLPTLSGGEAARVHLARALAQLPPEGGWLLLDEPTAALDLAQAERVLRLLSTLAASGVGVVAVLHDLGQALRHADRALVLRDGALVADGAPADVLNRALVAEVWQADAEVAYDDEGLPLGVLPSR